MRKRCFNPRNKEFHLYGGKGVTICKEWDNFLCFKTWALNNGYADNLSIDRIDSNGNYEPRNCRWATPREQTLNRCRTIWLTIDDVTKCLTDWCNEYGISRSTVQSRIKNKGWDAKKAVTTPAIKYELDLVGKKFNRLLVLKRAPNSKYGTCRFVCQCDCGNIVTVGAKELRCGYTKSCGCFQKEQVSKANYKRYHSL